MYIGSAGPGPGGRAEGRAAGRTDGRTAGRADFERQYNGFHRCSYKMFKTHCVFSVVSHPTGAQVSICIAKMKKWLRKRAILTVFFDCSHHAGAQVPIFTPKMKNLELAEIARFARLSTRKWDFRRRSRPRELAQRSQDDVSLNKLLQIKTGRIPMAQDNFKTPPDPKKGYKNQNNSKLVGVALG